MRPPVRRPITTLVRDARGLLCSACHAIKPAAVRMAQPHGYLVLCPGCIEDATKRLRFLTTTTNDTEGSR